jgi:hypothetical protein
MKRYGYVLEKIVDDDNLINAFYNAQKHKRKKAEAINFEMNLLDEIKKIKKELIDGTYKPKPYCVFYVYSPKKRLIHAPCFRDVVVQHAIYQVIYPIFNPTLICQNYACRKGYGTHKAGDYLKKCIRKVDDNLYYLQLDIQKYFYLIDHEQMKKIFLKKIKDKKAVNLLMMFVGSDLDKNKGLPIGNLLSQLFASMYLNEMDNYIKKHLFVKRYVRYVDDFVCVGLTKELCFAFKEKIKIFLKRFKLKFSKYTIQKIKKDINFCGYRHWKNKRLIRKYSLHKFTRKLKKNMFSSCISILGRAYKTQSIKSMIEQVVFFDKCDNFTFSIVNKLFLGGC